MSPAIHPQLPKLNARVLLHNIHNVGDLIGNALKCRAGKVCRGCAECNTGNGAAGILVPMRRSQASEWWATDVAGRYARRLASINFKVAPDSSLLFSEDFYVSLKWLVGR